MSFLIWHGNVLGKPAAASTAPVYSSAEIGNVDNQTVVVTFNKAIESPLADYVAGFTVKINDVGDTITAGVRAGGNTQIELTITTMVSFGDAVTLEYDDTAGDIRDIATATDLATFPAFEIDNNVGQFMFNNPGSSMFLVIIEESEV